MAAPLIEHILRLEFGLEGRLVALRDAANVDAPTASRDSSRDSSAVGAGGGDPASLDSLQHELRSINQSLRSLSALVEKLKGSIPAGARDAAAEALREKHREHVQVHVNLRARARQASLVLRRRQERDYQDRKRRLLEGARGSVDLRKPEHRNAASMLRTTTDVTSTLRRARALMADTTGRVNEAALDLDKGSKRLEGTLTEGSGFSGSVKQSKALLRKLEARNRTDRILTGFGVVLFCSVVAYIVYKRTLGRFL